MGFNSGFKGLKLDTLSNPVVFYIMVLFSNLQGKQIFAF